MRIKVKRRPVPVPADEYVYLEQVAPNAWRVGDDETGAPITAQDAIDTYQALTSGDADALAADAHAALEAEAAAAQAKADAEAEAAAAKAKADAAAGGV